MKKWIALLLALSLLLTFVACGEKQTNDTPAQTPDGEVTEVPEEENSKGVYTSTYFTVSYDPDSEWAADEDNAVSDENGGSVYVCVSNGNAMDQYVYVEAKAGAYEDFCSSIESMGYDVAVYEDGGCETTEIGGQQLLPFDNGAGVRVYIGHHKDAAITFRVRTNVPDSDEAAAIIESIVFTVQ